MNLRIADQLPHRARSAHLSTLAYVVFTAMISAGVVLLPLPHAVAQPMPPPPPPAYPPQYPPQYQQPYQQPQAYPPPAYPVQQVTVTGAAPAAGGDEGGAAAAGESAGSGDVNGTLWFFAGCLLSWVGIILGYVIEPSPPAGALVGKSPAFVGAYTTAYKQSGKSAQGKAAIWGCVVGGLAEIVFLVVYYVAVGAFLFSSV